MDERKRRIMQLANMKSYLHGLSQFIGREVLVGELVSLRETDVLMEKNRSSYFHGKSRYEIAYDDDSREKIKIFLHEMSRLNSSKILVWMEKTDVCGALFVESMLQIAFDFDNVIKKDDVVVLICEDMKDKVMLDFDLSDSSAPLLRLNIFGSSWSLCKYPGIKML
ncbi:MAG TPA: hypothetical protein VIM98_18600 [Dyella sp.]|uniref:hypothetical protein n=1 Tax=Dyella sp. TaxID=1869338 RepID=UPI002F93E5E9